MVEDVVDDEVHIGDVDFTIEVHILKIGYFIISIYGCTRMASATAIDDDMNHAVGIGNVDLAVAVHITGDASWRISNDSIEILPVD